MAITYTWTISALDCRVSEEGMSDVVQTVHWRYRGTNEDGVTYETYSATAVPTPTPEAFIPYPDLYLAILTEWLESILDMEEIEANIAAQIELIIHPVMVTLPLPTGSVSL
jgi:hypothetical protein